MGFEHAPAATDITAAAARPVTFLITLCMFISDPRAAGMAWREFACTSYGRNPPVESARQV
jgi:hypothetical protein